MSQNKTRSRGSASANGRRGAEIDLEKSAVTDVTPKAEAAAEVVASEPPQVEQPPEPVAPAHAVEDPKPEPVPAEAAAPPVEDPPTAVPPPVPARSGGSGFAGGAVAGALFGVLGAFGYGQYLQPMVAGPDPRIAKIEASVAAAERKAGDAGQIEQKLLAQIKTVEAKAAALEQKAAAPVVVPPATDGKTAEQIAPLDERLKAAEARLKDAQDKNEALAKRVEALAKVEMPKVDLAPITSKVADLERLVGTSAARTVLSADTAQAFEGRIKAVEQAAKDADAASKASVAAVKGLESSVGGMKANRPVETAGAVLSIASLARRGFEQGEAVGAYATALGALGVAEAVLAPLKAYAQAGAPTPAALADQFAALAAKLPKPQAAASAQPKSAGIMDKITSGLLSQVEVKPVGAAAMPDATGIAGIVRQKLLGGDFASVATLLGSLPAEQQSGLKPFADALNARVSALAAFRTIEGEALAALSRR